MIFENEKVSKLFVGYFIIRIKASMFNRVPGQFFPIFAPILKINNPLALKIGLLYFLSLLVISANDVFFNVSQHFIWLYICTGLIFQVLAAKFQLGGFVTEISPLSKR